MNSVIIHFVIIVFLSCITIESLNAQSRNACRGGSDRLYESVHCMSVVDQVVREFGYTDHKDRKILERAVAESYYDGTILAKTSAYKKEQERRENYLRHSEVCETNGSTTRCWYEERTDVKEMVSFPEYLMSFRKQNEKPKYGLSLRVRELHDKKDNASTKEIAILQEALIVLRFDSGPANGIYGEQTRKALENFQKSIGEEIDTSILSTVVINKLAERLERKGY